ncbi:extracellular solute-binding protein [Microbispora sp. H10836]|uniref:extracellular solute-binding protein n=1 Tax=Microbispora sp. H10836 TaxID=2729106 RepID=UPI001474E7A6|nr:extracellular solute-binding protein [Microbispora sp. H10836]
MNDRNTPLKLPYRILLVAAAVVPVVLSTAVGSGLVNATQGLPDDAWGWGRLCLGAALLVFAAFALNILGWMIRVLLRRPENEDELRFLESLNRLGRTLGRPSRVIATLAALALIAPIAWLLPNNGLEPGTLYIMSAKDESGPANARRILVQQWNQAHPGNPVEFVGGPDTEPDKQHARMVQDARKAHQADVYVLDVVYMPEFISNGYLRPIDESGRSQEGAGDDFLDNVLNTCRDMSGTHEGLWALPWNTDVGLLYRHSGARGPASWADYFPGSANAAHLVGSENLTVTALEAIWAHEGDVVNQDGRLVLTPDNSAVDFDENVRDALKDLADVYRGKDPEDSVDAEAAALREFANGKTGVMRNWPVAYDKLAKPPTGLNSLEVTRLPHASVLGGQNLAMSKWTDKPRAAQALIEFLTSPSSELILFEVGGFAPTRDYAYRYATRPFRTELENAVMEARPRPITPHYTKFSEAFREGILYAIRNKGRYPADFPQKLATIAAGGSHGD